MKGTIILTLAFLSQIIYCCAQSNVKDINEKAYDDYVLSNKRMVAAYQKALKWLYGYDLDGSAKKALSAGQEAFLIYRSKEGKLQDKIYHGGSMLPTFRYRVLKKMTDN